MNNSPIIEQAKILSYPHGFSTRLGGFSKGDFSSLNLGMKLGDDKGTVTQNYQAFLNECKIGYRPFVYGNQVHKNHVHIATKKDAYFPFKNESPIEADGYVTNVPDLPLVIFTADCVPILLEDSKNKVIGAIHSGWRSTVADIEGEAIKQAIAIGAQTENIHIAIGPAIEKCCFEVGPEVIDATIALLGSELAGSFYSQKSNGKFMLDLKGVVKERFIQFGIAPDNIEYVGGCTMCNNDRYYSHRVSGLNRGSLACSIMLP